MKIAANALPFSDIAPASSAAGNNSDYGRAFESTIRDVAKDSTAKVSARDERRPSSQDDADRQSTSAAPEARSQVADKSSETKSGKAKGAADDGTAMDDETKSEDSSNDPIAFLGRLLGGTAVATAAGATAAVDEETATDERVIVVSLETVAGDAVAEDAAGAGARGKVRLEVVHMETHFEPRSDAFVLVEGGDANAAAQAAAEEGAPVSFDQALARLSARKAEKSAATGEESKTSSEVVAAKAEVVVAQEVTAQERTKDRSRSKASAEVASRAVDLQSDGAELQTAAVARKKDASSASAEKLSARLGQAASDAADARPSAAPAAKDATGVLPLASMTGQVAGRVIDALGSTLASQRPTDLPSEAYLRMTAGGAALKTLTIQLQPETLGQLDVSMRLVDGQLTLEIAATEAATAKVLAQDREGLRKLLQHAGFSVDDASITIVTRDNSVQPQVRAAAASDSAGAPQDSGSGAGTDPRQDGQESESRRQDAPRDSRPQAGEGRSRKARSPADYL